MAEKDKPQRKQATKPAVKKAAKVNAPARKRAAPKKATVKKKGATSKPVAPKSSAQTKVTAVADETVVTIALNKTAPPKQPENAQKSPPARHVWWRAAIMLGVVALVFAYIRNSAHTTDSLEGKTMAPSPWAPVAPSDAEPAQAHPWELTPVPEGNNLSATQPHYAPLNPQEYPKLEPWQPPPSSSGATSQPYYPPPPGYYGYPPATDNATPYPQ